MIPLIEKSEQISIMVWSKLKQGLYFAMSTMSLFLPRNASKFITYTLIPLENIIQELIGYP